MKQNQVIKELSRADYITLTATLLVIAAVWLLWHDQLYLASAVAFASMFLDYLDGTIARKYGGSPYGAVLDSLYDIIGFVLFPVLVINVVAGWEWWSLAVTGLYYLSASVRLARFTVHGYIEHDKRYYVGLPVLYSKYALLIALFVWAELSVLIVAAMIPLMASSVLIKKPHPVFAHLNLFYAGVLLLVYLQ